MVLVGLVRSDFNHAVRVPPHFRRKYITSGGYIICPWAITLSVTCSDSSPKGRAKGEVVRARACGIPKPPSPREVARAARRREFAYKSRRRRTNFLIPKKKTPHPQTKGRGALHSTRCHPNSVFSIKTALFSIRNVDKPGPFSHDSLRPSQSFPSFAVSLSARPK